MAGYQDFLNAANVKIPNYYRSQDSGVAQFDFYREGIAKATAAKPFTSDLTDLLVLGNINSKDDPFYLASLTNLSSSANIDIGTQKLAQRQLYLTNQERKAAGLSIINAPGGAGFTEVSPTAPTATAPIAPTAPYNPGPMPAGGLRGSALQTYNNNMKAYQAALPAYTTAYNAYSSQLSTYQTGLATYQSNLAGFEARKVAYDLEAKASDAVLSSTKSKADQISKSILAKRAEDENMQRMTFIKNSLAGVSKLFAGRAANVLTPSQVIYKRPTLGGN